MPCHTRMKIYFLQGLLWLYLLGFGFMVTSLNPGYLDFDNLPDTNFSCVGKVIGGYYADLETSCQMFHVCTIGQLDEPMDIRFLCLNGTVFDQETRVCERIDEVDCTKSEQFYSLNLELYGNTQPPIVEESSETKTASIPKPVSSTTTTTTTRKPVYQKTSRVPFYSTATPPTATVIHSTSKVISSHHFPVGTSSDIRFNPEEINVSLKQDSPPEIRIKPHSYQQQDSYNTNEKKNVPVATQRPPYKPSNNEKIRLHLHPSLTTQTPKTLVSYGLTHSKNTQVVTPSDINYEFTYQQPSRNVEYNTELPQRNYQYSNNNFRPLSGHSYHQNNGYRTSTYRTEYHPTTKKINYPPPTTYRSQTIYPSIKQQSQFNFRKTEKPPQRIQIPLPLLPSLPPLTFSSPAPFSLSRHHIDSKRYTNEHQAPRIIISASASVSDASGRRLNYSLGTIGTAQLFERAPASYDDYKEDDVSLDPFYRDVPKLKSASRRKRNTQRKSPDIIKNDQEAVDVLKFLFDWYTNNKEQNSKKISIPVASEDITEINDQLSPLNDTFIEISEESEENALQDNSTSLIDDNDSLSVVNQSLSDEDLSSINRDKKNIMFDETTNTTDHTVDVELPSASENQNQTIYYDNEAAAVNLSNNTEYFISNESGINYEDNFAPVDYYDDYSEEIVDNLNGENDNITNTISNEGEYGYNETINVNDKSSAVNTETDYENDENINAYNESINVNDESIAAGSNNTINEEAPSISSKNGFADDEALTENDEDLVVDDETTEIVEENSETTNVNGVTGTTSVSLPTATTTATELLEITEVTTKQTENQQLLPSTDYVDDNYEPLTYREATTLTEASSKSNYEVNVEKNFVEDRTKANVVEEKKDSKDEVNIERNELLEPTTEKVQPAKHVEAAHKITTQQRLAFEEKFDTNRKAFGRKPNRRGKIKFNNRNLDEDDVVVKTTTSNAIANEKFDISTVDISTTSVNVQNYPSTQNYYTSLQDINTETTHFDETTVTPGYTDLTIATTTEGDVPKDENYLSDYQNDISSTTSEYSYFSSTLPSSEKEAETTSSVPNLTEQMTKFIENIEGTTKSIAVTKLLPETSSISDFTTISIPTSTILTSIMPPEMTTTLGPSTEQISTTDVLSTESIEPYTTETPKKDLSQMENILTSTTTVSPLDEVLTEVQMTTTSTTSSTVNSALQRFYSQRTRLPWLRRQDPSKRRSQLRHRFNYLNKDLEHEIKEHPETVVQKAHEPVKITNRYNFNHYNDDHSRNDHRSDEDERKSMEDERKFMADVRKTTESIKNATEDIRNVTEDIRNATEDIRNATEDIRNATEDVRNATEDVRNATEDVRNATEDVRNFTEAVRNTTEHVRNIMKDVLKPTQKPKPEVKVDISEVSNQETLTETIPTTVAALLKSVNPTQAEKTKEVLVTTPISKYFRVEVRKEIIRKHYIFNCFGKEVNKFYSDPRDCRLFHYCTPGYSKNQLLDMKFVCDFGTYFDDEKLLCTKEKPLRCL